MSPVPRASEASLLGRHSAVTITMCDILPFRFLIRFSASERAFCDRSLLSVNLQETQAWSIGNEFTDSRSEDRRAVLGARKVPLELMTVSGSDCRVTITSALIA